MKKSHPTQKHPQTQQIKARLALFSALAMLASGCVDVRSAAHSTTGFVTGDRDAREQSTSSTSGPTPDRIGYANLELTIDLAQEPGRVSAFGLRWIVIPELEDPRESGAEISRPVRDLPDLTSEIVGSLANWQSDFWVAERTRQTSAGKWRRVTLNDGTAGWIEARYLLAQPETITTKDQRLIRAIVEAGAEGLATSDMALLSSAVLGTAVPASVNTVTAAIDGKEKNLLLDWSGGQVTLVGVFLAPVAQ